MTQLLNHLQIIMVNTTLPANIGSAARAMHTMGLSQLTVIDPKLPIDDTSYAHAAGGTHILNNAKVVDTLEDAIADSKLIFAASSRSRTMPRPVVTPSQAAQIMAEFLQRQQATQEQTAQANAQLLKSTSTLTDTLTNTPSISILFGREDRGLTNDELAVADFHIQIDANPDYPVLNVASAVQVIASFIYSYFCHDVDLNADANTSGSDNDDKQTKQLIHNIRQQWDVPAISHRQQQQLTEDIIDLMQSLELANKDDLRLLPQRLSRLTSRLQLDEKEYQLIKSVLGKLQMKKLQKKMD